MLSYVIRRTLVAIPTLFVIITAAFFMMRIAPGGPFDSERHLPPEIERNIEAAYNLDKPVYEQYFLYIDRLAHGDLGPSFKTRDFTVTQLIADGLPVSLRLGLSAMIAAIVLGIVLGTVAALNQNGAIDYLTMSAAMIGITIPTFVTAPILTLIFGVYGVRLFGYDLSLPVGGWNDGALANMILPVTVLALPQIAVIARLLRGSMVEVLHSNYIRTARAKGLPNHVIVFRHALRAAAAAAGQLSRAGRRRPSDRLADRREHLRHSRHRPLLRRRRAQSRLHARAGRRHLLRGLRHPASIFSPTFSTRVSIRA